jgi:hypothetical protein
MLKAQLRALRYRGTDSLAGLTMNSPVNTRQWFRLTDSWAICITETKKPVNNQESYDRLWRYSTYIRNRP